MSKQIDQLIVSGNQLEALELLEKAFPNEIMISMLYGRVNRIKDHIRSGIISQKDASIEENQINAALFDLSKKVPDSNTYSTPKTMKTEEISLLRKFNDVFQSIKKDVEDQLFSKSNVEQYLSTLNSIFETSSFNTYADSLNTSDWNDLFTAEKRQRIEKVLNTLLYNEEKLRIRVTAFHERKSGTVSLDESMQMFFNRPSIQSWQNLKGQLQTRFSDTSLFGERVVHAFNGWVNKLDGLDDEMSFAMDFNFDYRSDFGAFLNTNLQPKNFNYA